MLAEESENTCKSNEATDSATETEAGFVQRLHSAADTLQAHCTDGAALLLREGGDEDNNNSASAAVVLGFLIKHRGIGLREAWDAVASARPSVLVSQAHFAALCAYEGEVTGNTSGTMGQQEYRACALIHHIQTEINARGFGTVTSGSSANPRSRQR